RTPPGPVAGIEWVEKVVKYLLSEGIAPQKISMGVPTYSVHWFADYTEERGGFSNGRQVGYDRVQHLLGKFDAIPQWHEKGGCHYAFWDNGGVYEYLFIEDAESLKLKLGILEKYHLRGISVWVLGREDPRFWEVLRKRVVKK
ncbi:MAG: hypothetical protein KDD06_27270, partial [Phaeodactylibacter sp.]|nr:hypothetical protein [Phaeodactylibacter sp.]